MNSEAIIAFVSNLSMYGVKRRAMIEQKESEKEARRKGRRSADEVKREEQRAADETNQLAREQEIRQVFLAKRRS